VILIRSGISPPVPQASPGIRSRHGATRIKAHALLLSCSASRRASPGFWVHIRPGLSRWSARGKKRLNANWIIGAKGHNPPIAITICNRPDPAIPARRPDHHNLRQGEPSPVHSTLRSNMIGEAGAPHATSVWWSWQQSPILDPTSFAV